MKQLTKRFFLLILLFGGTTVFGQNIPPKPSPAQFVNDKADMLTSAQRNTLESKLKTFSDKTSNQVVILTVNSLEGYTVEEYSIKVAQTWGIGQKGQDNGILILISKNDRKMRVEVGYGLEAVITDAYAKQIINQTLKPFFKQGKFYTGLHDATNLFIKKIKADYTDTSLQIVEKLSNTANTNSKIQIIRQRKVENEQFGESLIWRSMYVYPLVLIIVIILLRIIWRGSKKHKSLLSIRFGLIALPFNWVFQLIVTFTFDVNIGGELIGLLMLDILINFMAWSVATIGIWATPSGRSGGSYSGGSYSSGNSYSSSYSDSYSSSYSDSYSDFGGGDFGGGGASGDW